ncbi:MAG: 30S ribosome-binding factor RbfA [Kiloniellales bacterium]|nr:30S ribosome-binding factor RbfA [Kiloniellales bacterium]
MSRSKPPSQRRLRVGEEIRHALTRVLGRGELRDPLLSEANVTITQVEVSPDLQNATAFAVPLGGHRSDEVVRALNRAAGYLRGQLGREIHLRYTPRLGFEADRSFDRADEVERLLRSPRVRRDLEQAEEDAATPARDRERAREESSGDGP